MFLGILVLRKAGVMGISSVAPVVLKNAQLKSMQDSARLSLTLSEFLSPFVLDLQKLFSRDGDSWKVLDLHTSLTLNITAGF